MALPLHDFRFFFLAGCESVNRTARVHLPCFFASRRTDLLRLPTSAPLPRPPPSLLLTPQQASPCLSPTPSTACKHHLLHPPRRARLIPRLPALISSFPGFNSLYAWIEVEGAPLKVYGVEQDGKKVVAYVEATNGKQFTVHYLDLTSTCSTSHVVRLYVDGSRCVVPHPHLLG